MKLFRYTGLSLMLCALLCSCAHRGARSGAVHDRSYYEGLYFASLDNTEHIRSYSLPDPLVFSDGRPVTTLDQWYGERRGELLELFETEMFGHTPGCMDATEAVVVESGLALDGQAVRKQVKIDFHRDGQYIMVLMYLPADAEEPSPVFIGINFEGNASVSDDPAILYPPAEHTADWGDYTPAPRGAQSSRWPLQEIIGRGYGVVTFHCADVDPDFDDGFSNGVTRFIFAEGQTSPQADQWGTISAWAWGLSRVLDYLETDADVDAHRVAVIGHSRMGKTALLAGARDERFAMAISNCSGCCGAALSRRNYGETVESITHLFPHWFCANFSKYAADVDSLPFDQHELLALMAPRPVYVASAEEDAWADPTGERLALQEARKVYNFLGLDRGLTGYHIHEGPHGISITDWEFYLDFADLNL